MTVSSSTDRKLTVDELVLLAWKRAAMVDVNATATESAMLPRMALGRQLLDIILDELGGLAAARYVRFLNVTMVANQQDYTLDEAVIDVVGDSMYIGAGEDVDAATGETLVRQINGDQWQRLSNKGTSGQPTHIYADRGTTGYTITMKVYPRPSEAGTIRLRAHYAPADTDKYGSSTIDCTSAVNAYLLHELAYQLCDSSGGDPVRANGLMKKAEALRINARRAGAEHAPPTLEINLTEAQTR